MPDSEEDKLTVPELSEGDKLHLTARSLVSMIPVLGGAAKELLSFVWMPPLERRRVEWMNGVAERLKQLESEKEGFRFEDLREDPLFITILTEAFRIALRTHQQEKIDALQNAVVNAALKINIDDDTQQTFLEYVDSFTPSHLKVLDFLSDPRVYGQRYAVKFGNYSAGGVSTILEEAIPELRGRRDFYDQLVRDLHSRGLLNIDTNGHSHNDE